MATRRDAGEELQYAAQQLNKVVDGIEGIRTGLHVCRGNWSRREEVLLEGDYTRILPAFRAMNIKQFVLEYATPRAGELSVVGEALNDREIGLGVSNPRTSEPESVASIVTRAEEALQYYEPHQVYLNPDCGFGCFANRCINDEETAFAKLKQMVSAARTLREKFG